MLESSEATSISQPDPTLRLQALIAGWNGAARGESIQALHAECRTAVGPGGRAMLPANVLLVANLDTATLRGALVTRMGRGQPVEVQLRAEVSGQFDAALVPARSAGALADSWILALREELSIGDQVALYGHAVGHLLLNREQANLGYLPPLDPRDEKTHVDTLAELRSPETVRQRIDRRIIENYPQLTALLEPPVAKSVAGASSTSALAARLAGWGWRGQRVMTPYHFTEGRIYVAAGGIRRGVRLQADALLRADPSLPIALVSTARAGEPEAATAARLREYAHERLALPFGYLLADDGRVREWDYTRSQTSVEQTLDRIPDRDSLLARWLTTVGLDDPESRSALLYPYRSDAHHLRYYQEAAINRAVIAVLQAKAGKRSRRVLLTLATGTGKTKVAFQLIWKLKKARAIRYILFLTDREYLVGQAQDNEFSPFGEARVRVQGTIDTAHDIQFATYQALAGGLYEDYPRDFFDVVIVDECHRGSASEDSQWRVILDHFSGAVQIGLTATPLSNETVQTDDYFGRPVYHYSLRWGINDGFLAPYRVRRVLMGQGESEDATPLPMLDGETRPPPPAAVDLARQGESRAALLAYTPVIAEHLMRYLARTDANAKTIVFCVDQAHAELMEAALQRLATGPAARRGYVERIVSDEGTEGRRALGRFSTPDQPLPVIVTTSQMLSTGVDVPTCQNIVLARPVGSMVEFKQIIGRGTRLHPPDKTWFTILDYAGATRLFFDPDFDGDPEFVERELLIPAPAAPDPIVVHGESPNAGDGPATGESAWVSPVLGTVGTAGAGAAPAAIRQEPQPGVTPGDPVAPWPGGEGPSAARPQVNAPQAEYTVPPQPAPATQPTAGGAPETPAVGAAGSASPHPAPLPAGDSTQNAERRTENSELNRPAPDPRPPTPDQGVPVGKTRAGNTLRVLGEILWELAPDGTTLRSLSVRDYTRQALAGLDSPADLRARWLRPEQQAEIRELLAAEGVEIGALAEALRLTAADPFDVLVAAAWNTTVPTRADRVDRLRRERAAFLDAHGPKARAILDTILDKYVAGEAPNVADTTLLRTPPLDTQGTPIELMRLFGDGESFRRTLTELRDLLYSA